MGFGVTNPSQLVN